MLLLPSPGTAQAVGGSAQTGPEPEHGRQYDRLLIRNVHIIDGNGTPITGPSNVVVENDRIVSVGGRGGGDFDAVIEGDGGYLLPGLINIHAHIRPHPFGGDIDGYQYQFNLWLGCGITTIRSVGGGEAALRLREQSKNGEIVAPGFLNTPEREGKPPRRPGSRFVGPMSRGRWHQVLRHGP